LPKSEGKINQSCELVVCNDYKLRFNLIN